MTTCIISTQEVLLDKFCRFGGTDAWSRVVRSQNASAICLEQRLSFDALAFSINAIQLSYLHIRQIALSHPPCSSLEIGDTDLLTVFKDAWSIIDHTHTLLLLLSSLGKNIQHHRFDKFVSDNASIRKIRNKMDHLTQNIPNIANMTKKIPPVHGAISYIFIDADRYANPETLQTEGGEGFLIMHIYGAYTHQSHSAPIVNPLNTEVEWPVGCFQLSSFGININLSRIYIDTIDLEQIIENDVKKHVESSLAEYATNNNLDNSVITARGVVGLHVAIKIKFGT